MNKILLTILMILGAVLFIGLMGVYHAFVLSTLWAWFVVPFGIAKIGMAHAYGLSLIPATVLSVRGLYSPEDKRTEAAVASVLYPAVALLFGWIALGFM